MTATMTAPPRNNPLAAPVGAPLLGEIITWSARGVRITHDTLVSALASSGLDSTMARKLNFGNAWSRACRKLSENRVIRELDDIEGTLRFQFTVEHKNDSNGQFDYDVETILKLDKFLGLVTCDLPELQTHAQELLNTAVEQRNGGDLTRLIQRLFDKEEAKNKGNELFPIKEDGGAYFVLEACRPFIDKIDMFVLAVGGQLRRWPVAKTHEGAETAKSAVVDKLEALLTEHDAAIKLLTPETGERAMENAVKRIEDAAFKLKVYRQLLGDTATALEARYDDNRRRLKARVAELHGSAPVG